MLEKPDIWHSITLDFNNPLVKDFDQLALDDSRFDSIHVGLVVSLDCEQLKKLWQKTRKNYVQSTVNKKKSGEHDPDFFNYCFGRLDVLCVHYWMEAKPGLENFVEEKCP